MSKINRVVGRAAFGAMALGIACEPMIIELEHPPAAGAPGSAADSGENLAGAGDAPSDGGGDGGVSQGSAGRGSGGAGAPPLGAGGNASGGSAAAAGEGNGAACGDAVLTDVRNGHDLLPGYTEPPSPEVAQWISAMSLEQQIAQMQGVPVESRDYNDISRSQDVEVGGTVLRGFRYRNGSRGVNLQSGQDNRARDADNFSTSFPTQSIRGASWNPELEWRIGEAIGDETMASLNNVLIGPSVNILRHPYWGRAQEAYGEDAYHVGRMASAFIAGVQQHVAACARNFLAYTIEMNRANQDALADEQTVREIYGRPFQMAVQDGGVACVMTAYGKVNGVNSTLNAHLLRDVLKAPVAQGGFGFRGFVLSDWWAAPGDQGPIDDVIGVAQAAQMANSGLDIEMPWTLNYSSLQAALTAGGVTPAVVTEAASRVLEQKARFGTALATGAWG
ncbi:MAG TPA: glycoside hydrolase family 3 N-terminal domain-containing protein, partial [Polyangiaceae bacterium]